MKKLMIAVAIVCATALSQAATCAWTSGTLKSAESAAGGWSGTTLTTALVTMNVYLLDDEDAYNKITATGLDLYNAYSSKSADLSGTNSNGKGGYKGAISITEDPSSAGVEYAVVIATYTDATYGDMFVATKTKSLWNAGTQKGTAGNIVSGVGSWSAVPEPTSGLLLLLGMAGLALRRRHV